MSPRTLTSWFSGTQRLFDPAGDYKNYSLLSFKDVAQAYVLYILKHFHKYTPAQIERAMRELRKETKSRHPLLTLDRRTAAKNLMLNKPPRGSRGREVVNLSKFRNLVLTEVVDACSQRILKNSSGETLELFPWRFFEEDGDSRPVSMDPSILSGRLVVTGTRIPVSPSTMASMAPVASLQMTGNEAACASRATIPNPSRCEGKTNRSIAQ